MKVNHMTAEYRDILTADKTPTGKLNKRGEPFLENEYHLVAICWIVNKQGEFLITRRSFDKEYFGGFWEAQGGSVLSGETSLEAAVREVKEEVGLIVDPRDAWLFASHIQDDAIFDHWLFRYEFDLSKVKLQEGETIDVRAAKWSEIKELMETGMFFKEVKEVQDVLGSLI